MMRFGAMLSMALLLPAPLAAQGKLPLGFGGGSFAGTAGPADVEGQLTFAHSIAYRAFEDDDRTRRFTVVLLSDTPLPDFDGREALAEIAVAQKLAVLWTTVERNSGKVVLSRCLGPGLPGGDAEATGVDWHREDWAKGLMRGRLASPDTPPADAPCLADVYFAALAP